MNPHKPVDSGIGNWFSLNPGEVINLPDAWGAGNTDTGEDEAAGPDTDWHTLAEVEPQAPYFAPLAKLFRGTPDPEGSWRSYGTTLAPHFENVAPGEALGAVLELSAQGFYVALPGASGPVGWRKATAQELNHFQPDALRQLRGLTFWVEPAAGIEPPPPPSEGETGADDAGALTDRENLTHQTYAVHRGEGMIDIARKFGAATRPRWFAELRDANPTKAIALDPKTKKQVGWRSLNPGDIVNIPDVWAAADSPRPSRAGKRSEPVPLSRAPDVSPPPSTGPIRRRPRRPARHRPRLPWIRARSCAFRDPRGLPPRASHGDDTGELRRWTTCLARLPGRADDAHATSPLQLPNVEQQARAVSDGRASRSAHRWSAGPCHHRSPR